jgi:tetratricopeptide (TPR) repeat protein
MANQYQIAAALAENGAYEQAWKILGTTLNQNPNDPIALVGASHVMLHMGALPQAYHFAKAATDINSKDDGAWLNFGHAAAQLCLTDEAEKYYRLALQHARSASNRNSTWLCLSALYIDSGNFDKAESFASRLLQVDPGNKKAFANLGFCQLAKRDWANGWKNYHHTVGSHWRKKVRYKDEPEWDGSPGKTVAVYADQGIGDEISFASMVPDAAKLCRKLVLDCDGRLEHLFRRSFPEVTVYGTKIKDAKWAKADRAIDASLSIGQLGEFVRQTAEQFTGAPYLIPCPERTEQWRTTLGKKAKPTIGIAWTGGVPHTNARNRRVSLKDLLPVLSLDAHFVSLQYKDAAEEIAAFTAEHPGIDLVQYRWATLTDDYDDTAALVAACDYVLCIQTAVARTAGALGVPCSVLLPTASNWFYSNQGERVPWHDSIRIIRQQRAGSWGREIDPPPSESASHLGQLPAAAGKAA